MEITTPYFSGMKCTSHKLFYSSSISDSFESTRKSHAQILKSGFSAFDSLFRCYLDFAEEEKEDAFKLLDEITNWDSSSANSIIMSLKNHNHHSRAIDFFSRLPSLSVQPNQFILCNIMSAATALRDSNLGRQLHARVIKTGFANDVYVGSSLLDHYSKYHSLPIEDCQKVFVEIQNPNVVAYTTLIGGLLKMQDFKAAHSLFQDIPSPDRSVVTWNTMITGCSKMGRSEEAVDLFTKMLKEGISHPTQSTFPSIFTAVSNMAGIGMGRTIHAISIKCLENPNVYVASSLISFYAKCGSIEDSILIFERARRKLASGSLVSVVVWNAMMCGYAQNGRAREALELYRKMPMSPNDVTLLGVLFGCNHGGLVDEGYECFKQAEVNYPEIIRPEHYACVVNLFSRSMRFEDATKFLSELPFRPGVGFWKAFLAGYQMDSCTIDIVTKKIEHGLINSKYGGGASSSTYVLLSNAYAASGRLQKSSVIRQKMKNRGIEIIPGCSWIELKGQMHVFCSNDRRHSKISEIGNVLTIFQRTRMIL